MRKHNTKIIFNFLFVFLVFVFLFLVFNLAAAAELKICCSTPSQTCEQDTYCPGTPPGIEQGKTPEFGAYLRWLLKFLFGAVGILTFLMIVIGGLQYVAAGASGNPENIKNAKSRITMAIAGILLALSSWLILSVINPDLLKLELPSLKGPSPNKVIRTGTAFQWDCFDKNGNPVRKGVTAATKEECDKECESLPDNQNGYCGDVSTEIITKPKNDGEPCRSPGECLSGICEIHFPNPEGVCKPSSSFSPQIQNYKCVKDGQIIKEFSSLKAKEECETFQKEQKDCQCVSSEAVAPECIPGQIETKTQNCVINRCEGSQTLVRNCNETLKKWDGWSEGGECQKKNLNCEGRITCRADKRAFSTEEECEKQCVNRDCY